MPRETVLFVGVGRTDLQVLAVRDDGELQRLSIGRNLRHFHEALLKRDLAWELDLEAVDYPEAGSNDKVDWDQGQGPRYPRGCRQQLSERGTLVLVPAKLAAAAEQLKRIPDLRVASVVLFTTDRDSTTPPSIFHNEPIAAAPILAGWLAERMGLRAASAAGDIGAGCVGWIDILDGGLLTPAAGRDSPVNREALRRVEHAMREALQWSGPDVWACLSLIGGLPDPKEPIKACVEYLFSGHAFAWQAPHYTPRDFRWESLNLRDADENRAIDGRHQAVHSVLGPEEIGKRRAQFVSAGLWTTLPQGPRRCLSRARAGQPHASRTRNWRCGNALPRTG